MPSSGAFGTAAVTVLVLLAVAGLVVAGLQLLPPYAPSSALAVGATPVPAPVAQPAPARRGAAPARAPAPAKPGYLCGSTSGHRVTVVDGTAPCSQALLVAGEWLTFHASPGDGAGGAGTLYSWTCTARPKGAACTSRTGSTMLIER